jgi:radical SAM superfamily enzyme YgiQ (UPF0313 family)
MDVEDGKEMKILFINPIPPKNVVQVRVSMGVAYLSAELKKAGHETLLFCPWNYSEVDIQNKINHFLPDMIAVSSVSDQFELSKRIMSFIKERYNLPIIIGGIHATVSPLECVEADVLGVCIGEGDEAFPEFLELYEKGEDYTKVKNFWFKKDGKIIKNPLRPLIQDLDSLPFPDRELFDDYIPQENVILEFMTSRGCPFQCNYCINKVLQGFYGVAGYLRRRSVDNVLEEIKIELQKYIDKHGYSPKRIEFHDDLFTMDKKWLKEFSEKYRHLNQDYVVNGRVETIDEETIKLLKDSGCVELKMGVESGNERIRKEYLNRHMTNEQIINCFKLCDKYGLKTSSFNMIGIPGETEKEIQDTIELNRILQPSVVGVSIFRPYQGTQLHQLCKEKGYLTERKTVSFYEGKSVINLPTISSNRINYYYQIFQTAVYRPNRLPLVNLLIKLHLFNPIMKSYYFCRRVASKVLSRKIKDMIMGRKK